MPMAMWKQHLTWTVASNATTATTPIIVWDAAGDVTGGGTSTPVTWTTNAASPAAGNAWQLQWPWPQLYTGQLYTAPMPQPADIRQETPEERNARWAMRDRYAQEQAGHDHAARLASRGRFLEHERANARAEKLLVEMLSPHQAEELRASGHFHVRLMNGRRYRISRGQHGNVVEVDGAGRGLRSLCVQPVGHLPDADAMLAQKLWLETDEATLLRTANITPMRARA